LYIYYVLCFLTFFFSSRRRHTRCYRDWSSDVCSSDLDIHNLSLKFAVITHNVEHSGAVGRIELTVETPQKLINRVFPIGEVKKEIGRASCRERVEISVSEREV